MRFCVLLSLTLVSLLTTQPSGDMKNFWHDVPSSPLKFEIPDSKAAEEGRMITIRSLVGTVVSYDLGCVSVEHGTVRVHEAVRTWNLTQPPEKQFFPLDVLRTTSAPCEQKSQQLAVVKVKYKDGGVWYIPTN